MNRVRGAIVAAVVAAGAVAVAPPAHAGKSCFGKRPTIVGSNRSETIKRTGKADVIVARGGNDRIYGKAARI